MRIKSGPRILTRSICVESNGRAGLEGLFASPRSFGPFAAEIGLLFDVIVYCTDFAFSTTCCTWANAMLLLEFDSRQSPAVAATRTVAAIGADTPRAMTAIFPCSHGRHTRIFVRKRPSSSIWRRCRPGTRRSASVGKDRARPPTPATASLYPAISSGLLACSPGLAGYSPTTMIGRAHPRLR